MNKSASRLLSLTLKIIASTPFMFATRVESFLLAEVLDGDGNVQLRRGNLAGIAPLPIEPESTWALLAPSAALVCQPAAQCFIERLAAPSARPSATTF